MSVTSRSRYQGSGGHRLVWIVVMSLATNSVCFALNNQNYRLEKDLLRNYSRTVRPVQNLNTIINVSITFVVFSIFHIDEQNQAMTQNSYIALRWFDEFLKWDPQEYGGLTTIELSSKAIWLPYMDSINTFDPSSLFSSDQLSNAVVQASGQITWFQQNVLTTICRMDITYFPFDSQLCNISVSMWTSSTSQVQISEVVARQDDVFFVENSQWILKSLEATLGETSFGNESYSAFTVSFYLKRRRMFHTLTLIIPNVLLALLASLVFLIPSDGGEKMSFIMGLLLATGVSLTVLMDIMPRSSLHISVLMIYIGALSITSGLAVVASTCIVFCCSLQGTVGPKTLLLFKLLRKIICKDLHVSKQRVDPHIHVKIPNESKLHKQASPRSAAIHNLYDLQKDKPTSQETVARDDEEDHITWREVGAVLDQVCFRITIILVVGMTVVLMLILSFGS
ncbi:neuronal acetylcholine receptor subunit beta-3-like isoform X1 [Pomacea canaliculata]|uniref:neuronal acetylcholine receptor subunit beta-3-like isoform X1 n=1 Tax=Pomacea canaliculata TaxID=400727 RepID=UPI000D7288CC|nr:neuronal acetylcholine receptor subunit beta-3-like isoform X1 [Pomacea canaliculata]